MEGRIYFDSRFEEDRTDHGGEDKEASRESLVAQSGNWSVMLSSTHRKHREEQGTGQGYKPSKSAPIDMLPPSRLPS